jgi:glycogen synthase
VIAPRARRVLMTADAVGGVWRYALDLGREIGADGGEVLLAVMGPPPDGDQIAEAARIPGLILVPGDYRLEWMQDPWDDVDRAGAWLVDLARDWLPDVVHLNGFSHGALPWRAPVVVVAHSCVTSWWEAVLGEPAPAAWSEYRRRVRAGVAAADLVVAPTAAMLEALRHHYGPLRRTRVIPNGAAPDAYRVGEKGPFALYVGRLWDEAKNVAILVEIAGDLPWPVRLIGETAHPSGRPVETMTGVELLGPMPHAAVRGWLARAAVYVHPARYEPFGLSVLEAALSGCALVLADLPSLRETWDEAALFAPPDDASALRATLIRVMGERTERRTLSKRALVRARRLTAKRTAFTYQRAYDDLVKKRVRA